MKVGEITHADGVDLKTIGFWYSALL